MRGVRGPNENGVRRIRRPAREIGGPEIGRVELGAGDLDDAVNAADAGGGRVPLSAVRATSRARRISALPPRPSRERLSAMPLAVTDFTNSRREGRMLLPLGQRCCERIRHEPQTTRTRLRLPGRTSSDSELSAIDSSKASNLIYSASRISRFLQPYFHLQGLECISGRFDSSNPHRLRLTLPVK